MKSRMKEKEMKKMPMKKEMGKGKAVKPSYEEPMRPVKPNSTSKKK